jgi:hypothetical protein
VQPGVGRLHPLLEAEVGVALEQQIEPTAQATVVAAEARMVWVRHPALPHRRARIGSAAAIEHALVFHEIAVPAGVEPRVALHGERDLRHEHLAQVVDGLGPARLPRVGDVVGHGEAMHRAIGSVGVHRQIGLPGVADVLLKEAHLQRVVPDVVSVQVDAGRVDAGAGSSRALLPLQLLNLECAVRRVHRVVAVRVEQRHDQQRHLIQQSDIEPGEQVAREHERRLFAFHLPRMNAALNQHDGLAGGARSGRVSHSSRREDQERQLPALGRAAETGHVQLGARGCGELPQVGHDFAVRTGGSKARALGDAAEGGHAAHMLASIPPRPPSATSPSVRYKLRRKKSSTRRESARFTTGSGTMCVKPASGSISNGLPARNSAWLSFRLWVK